MLFSYIGVNEAKLQKAQTSDIKVTKMTLVSSEANKTFGIF